MALSNWTKTSLLKTIKKKFRLIYFKRLLIQSSLRYRQKDLRANEMRRFLPVRSETNWLNWKWINKYNWYFHATMTILASPVQLSQFLSPPYRLFISLFSVEKTKMNRPSWMLSLFRLFDLVQFKFIDELYIYISFVFFISSNTWTALK